MASLSGSTSRSLMRLLSTYWPGLQLPESLTGASKSISKDYSHTWQVSVGCCQEVLALCHNGLSTRLL